MNTDNDLRAQLAAAINPTSARGYPDPTTAVAPPSAGSHPNIDPAIAAASPAMMSNSQENGSIDDNVPSGDGRKGGKRELSQSKRAAQNRAAQRAFRQRKEGYIKKLEEQVREFHQLEENYKAIQNENYSLREYIIHLQSRLIESQGDFPQPPPNVNLNQPRPEPMVTDPMRQHPPAATQASPTAAPMGVSAINALQASAAQAVAGMADIKPSVDAYKAQGKQSTPTGPPAPSTSSEEDILRRQLQSANHDGLPHA